MALDIKVYGTATCEDTALVRSRLRSLGVPFEDYNVENDPKLTAYIKGLNHGQQRTPTIVMGEGKIVLVEPTLEELEGSLLRAGHVFRRPQPIEYSGELAERSLPGFSLPSSDGTTFNLASLRDHVQVVLFVAHGADCRVCQGYARQIMAARERFGAEDAVPVIIVQAGVDVAAAWAHEFLGGKAVLADAGGAVKKRLAAYFGVEAGGVLLLILDRYMAPRAGAFAADAGGLLTPREAVEWLSYIASECPE